MPAGPAPRLDEAYHGFGPIHELRVEKCAIRMNERRRRVMTGADISLALFRPPPAAMTGSCKMKNKEPFNAVGWL